MLDGLLLQLERVAPVSKHLENIDDLVRVLVRQAGVVVEDLKRSARAFENVWQSIIVEVAKGHTAEVQATRPNLLVYFETTLDQLKHTHALLACFSALGRADLPDPNALAPEIESMERLKTRVFDRWHSTDDLERLAVEQYPLSQSRLQQIAAMHAPPLEWYQGEEERLFRVDCTTASRIRRDTVVD